MSRRLLRRGCVCFGARARLDWLAGAPGRVTAWPGCLSPALAPWPARCGDDGAVAQRGVYAGWAAVLGAVVIAAVSGAGVLDSAVPGSQPFAPLSQAAVAADLRTAPSPGPSAALLPPMSASATPTATASTPPSAAPRSASPQGTARPTPAPSGAGGPKVSSQPAPSTPAPSGKPTSRPTSKPTPTPTPKPTPSPKTQTRLIYTGGGSVVAVCSGAVIRLISFSPAQGFRVAHVVPGPAAWVVVDFASTRGGHDVWVGAYCRRGIPTEADGQPGHWPPREVAPKSIAQQAKPVPISPAIAGRAGHHGRAAGQMRTASRPS